MKSSLAVVGTLLLLGLAVVANSAMQFKEGQEYLFKMPAVWGTGLKAEARVLTSSNWNDLVEDGKESDAIYGDFVLRNTHVKVVIAQPLATRNANMTVRDVAGAVIDLTSAVADNDQLAAFYPGKKKFAYRAASFRGEDGKDVAPTGTGVSGQSASVVVKADATEQLPEVTVVYSLGEKDMFVTVTSTFTNRSTTPLSVPLEDDFRADGGKEEMVRSPNSTTDRFWLYDRYWGQAYGLDAAGRKMQLNSDARTTTIKYETEAGELQVKLAPGESFELTRHVCSSSNVFNIHDQSHQRLKTRKSTQKTYFQFLGLFGEQRDYWLELARGETVVGSVRLPEPVPQSNLPYILVLPLEPGDYNAKLFYLGNLVAQQRLTAKAEGGYIDIEADTQFGWLQGRITDVLGEPIPCKIELKPLTEGSKLDFGPETGEFAVRNLIYSPDGRIKKKIPTGKYAVTISHGSEFDAIFSEINVAFDEVSDLSAKLIRSVETPGWVSSDFHSHSTPSGDNTGSQLGRVLNLVCENIEFAPCTEHNRVSTYQPHIDRLGIGQFMSSVSGIELTGSPLPLNHQNVFPMQYKPRTQDGGGPATTPDLESQIERLALWNDRSEKLLQVNHPDPGWMFYDKDGDGKPDAGHERAFPFMDVMEIHPIDNALSLGPEGKREGAAFHNRVFNWLQLLNQGFRIYGVVNTDAHYNFHGSGWLRNWIQSSTDDPAKIDHMEMVHAAEQGRIVMSNGPYLEVTAHESGKTETVVSGQDLKAASGKVTLKVRVQCPNWLDVDTLFVLVNGRKHAVHDYTREKNPDLFRGGAVKFDRSLEIDLKSDAHLVVVTGDEGGNLTKVYGEQMGKAQPAAMTNPIFVDVDGNGFVPNKDTLGHPLPVKHPNSK
ncbi:MAG: CehA/McbA family metallohydrolase [Planctomycetota bacterium]